MHGAFYFRTIRQYLSSEKIREGQKILAFTDFARDFMLKKSEKQTKMRAERNASAGCAGGRISFMMVSFMMGVLSPHLFFPNALTQGAVPP